MKQPNFTITSNDSTSTQLKFDINSTYTFVINALRRVIMSELDCVGIPDIYKESSSDIPGVFIKENTGRLHNEFIRHRLSMLPIKISLSELQEYDYKFILDVKNTTKEPINIYSSNIQIFRRKKRFEPYERQKLLKKKADEEKTTSEEEVTPKRDSKACKLVIPWEEIDGEHSTRVGIIPTDPILDSSNVTKQISTTNASILLTRLYNGESLVLEMIPSVSCANLFAGFSPISTCTYMHKVDKQKKKEEWERILAITKKKTQDADELKKHIEILQSQFENQGQYLCKNENDFHVMLETIGTYSCHEIIKMGIDKLIAKIQFVICFLTNNIEVNLGTNFPCLTDWIQDIQNGVPCIIKINKSGLHAPHQVEKIVVATTEPIYEFTNIEELPRIDGEDIQVSDKILLKNQEKSTQNGIYLIHSVNGKYSFIKDSSLKDNRIYIISRGAINSGSWFINSQITACHGSKCAIQLPSLFTSDDSSFKFDINDDIDEIILVGNKEESINITTVQIERFNLNMEYSKTDDILSSTHMINIDKEDHTIGNLIQGYMYEKYCKETKGIINAVAYRKPHPLESFIELRIDFNKSVERKIMIQLVIKELKYIMNDFSKLLDKWNKL